MDCPNEVFGSDRHTPAHFIAEKAASLAKMEDELQSVIDKTSGSAGPEITSAFMVLKLAVGDAALVAARLTASDAMASHR